MKLRTSLTAAAIALAIASPVSITQASEGPFEPGGQNIFETLRDKKMNKQVRTATTTMKKSLATVGKTQAPSASSTVEKTYESTDNLKATTKRHGGFRDSFTDK